MAKQTHFLRFLGYWDDTPSSNQWPSFAGLICLAIGRLGALAIGQGFKKFGHLSDVVPKLQHRTLCTLPMAPADGLRLYAADANWVAAIVLESVVAVIALGFAVAVIAAVRDEVKRHWQWAAVVALGLVSVVADILSINNLLQAEKPGVTLAFLSTLLSAIDCKGLRESVRLARLIGESTGILVGVAMCVTLVFLKRPSAADLRIRMNWLHHLLYVASLLFVAGIIMSQANFGLVLAHWEQADEKISKALGEVIHSGMIQAGVGYSTILIAFFFPARVFLGWLADVVMQSEVGSSEPAHEKAWLAAHDLGGSWQEDARQILALLAPILAAPVFDAIAKLGATK